MKVNNIRISLTQRCNLNCIYCHHEGENRRNGREMTIEEFEEILKIAEAFNIHKLKLTGGEPLMRKDIVEIVHTGKRHMKEVSMTTNGLLLPLYAKELKGAGLDRVNISLDSLNGERFKYVTSGKLDRALMGIRSAKEAGIEPIKINMVIMKGINDDEIEDLIDFSSKNGCILQLIELEACRDDEEFYKKYHYDLSGVEENLEKRAKRIEVREMHHRKKYFLENGGEVEIVKPMHNTEFCRNCTRIRVTSDCKVKPCLLDHTTFDIRPYLFDTKTERAKIIFEKAIKSKKPYWRS